MISFIVPAYNAERTIEKCIESILKQDFEKEVIVVDNGSKDNTRAIIKKYPIKLLTEKERGAGIARNKGLEESKGDYIAFIDSDVTLPDSWIKKAINKLKSDNILGGVGGAGKSAEKNTISECLNALLLGIDRSVEEKHVDTLATMDVLYKREAIEKLRFSEVFTRAGGEDVEFNFEVRKKGYKLLFSKELWVYHQHPLKLEDLIKKWFNYGKFYPLPYLKHKERINKGFYFRISYFPVLVLLIVLSFILNSLIYLVLLQIFSLFVVYFCIGVKVTEGKVLFAFPFVHTLKQLSQLVGINVGFIERLGIRK